jgi:ubiquinone/menaquinone biosynthesis C-methylase UbiE
MSPLPFDDSSFDAAASTFGVMFAPNQAKAASEMLRVVRKGGKIDLANWTPGGFIGAIFKIIGAYVPSSAGLQSPALWGTDEHLETLFGAEVEEIEIIRKNYNFRYRSADHWLDIFCQYYGPIHKAFGALEESKQDALAEELKGLIANLNQSGSDIMLVPGNTLKSSFRDKLLGGLIIHAY